MKSPVMLLSSLLDDVLRLEPGVKGLDRDLITIESRFKHEGIGFLSCALSSLCDALDQGFATGRFACPTSFSKQRGKSIPKFLSGLICKVFDPNTGLLLDEPQVGIVKCLREILRSFKKINVSQKREDKLHKSAVVGFIETDDSISRNSFPRDKVNLLNDVAKLVLQKLHSVDYCNLPVRHGPGGVAERVKANQKWSALRESCQHDAFLAAKYGLDVLSSDGGGTDDYRPIESASFEDILYDADTRNGLVPQLSYSGLAKLLTVPKSVTARRTITMEPVLNMFIQQGLNSVLRDSITSCVVLRRCLALTDQSRNQNLARIGSRNGNYATIDLSSASDLLDLNLVKLIFASKQEFLISALDCRSSHCDTDLFGIINLKKFAGMGNALTFPVQSIAFALLAICAVLCEEGHRPSYGYVKRAAGRIRVYGDDIIVETKYVRQVYEWLAAFGLKINQTKSFTTGKFRESCGLDAFDGHDVTPVYVREWPLTPAQDPDLIASLVSTSNQYWMLGLYSAANMVKEMVEELYERLPLVSRHSAGLGWHSRVDTTVAHKWDGKLQQLVFRGRTIVARLREDRIDGYAALSKSLHSLEARGKTLSPTSVDAKHLERSVMRFHTRILKQWLPAHAG